jgi:hypothetical protein
MSKSDLSSRHFVSRIVYRKLPPMLNCHIHWTVIERACGIEAEIAKGGKNSCVQDGCNHLVARRNASC